jgi:hypothetical protein
MKRALHIKIFKFKLSDENQMEIDVRIIHRDITSAMIGAVMMSQIYLYPNTSNNGFTLLEENEERYS